MAVDRRERILARLVDIAREIEGVRNAYRNKTDVSAVQRPAIVIFDADEAAAEGEPGGRPSASPNMIELTPEIWLLVGRDSETVGSDLNEFRMAVIKAVLFDSKLGISTGTNGVIRYRGCVTDLGKGRTTEAAMMLSFTFNYPLMVSELN